MDLMESSDAPGRVYNIGATEEISIESLADTIMEMTDSKSEKHFISYEEAYGRPFDDMMRRVPCLDRIREAVGYQPKTKLPEMLERIIAAQRTAE